MDTIGFIGVGHMGSGMVRNLAASGFAVLAFDTDEKKLTEIVGQNVQRALNIQEVINTCSTVIVCLPHPRASKEVVELARDRNTFTTTIIETSTLTPEIVTKFAKQFEEAGKTFVSAPMVGGKNHAANGDIEFLVEGVETLWHHTKPVLAAMGKARYMGVVPSATLAKLTFNLCRYANIAVAVESYRLLQKYDANAVAVHEFMTEQSLDNFGQVWAEDIKEMMLHNVAYKPSQVPKKDLTLLQEMAQAHGVDSELIDAIKNMYLTME